MRCASGTTCTTMPEGVTMDYHALTKKCDGMCDSCECPPAEFECQGEPSLCDNPRGCDCSRRTCEQGCNGCDECTDYGDEPCVRGCKPWECRAGWPDDPTLKPDIAALNT